MCPSIWRWDGFWIIMIAVIVIHDNAGSRGQSCSSNWRLPSLPRDGDSTRYCKTVVPWLSPPYRVSVQLGRVGVNVWSVTNVTNGQDPFLYMGHVWGVGWNKCMLHAGVWWLAIITIVGPSIRVQQPYTMKIWVQTFPPRKTWGESEGNFRPLGPFEHVRKKLGSLIWG